MPTNLDHLIFGTRDLRRGISWVEELTGLRAALGGVHPGRGTQNALLALGPGCYLEILAPDPDQNSLAWHHEIATFVEPRLIAWAVHTDDLAGLARRATSAGFPVEGPVEGSRSRPDGKVLRWKSLNLQNDRGGLLPFFLEWHPESVHPSADAPGGCELVSFHLQSPDPLELTGAFRTLGIDVAVELGPAPALCAQIKGPRGEVRIPH